MYDVKLSDYIIGRKVKCNQDDFYVMVDSNAVHIPKGSIFKVMSGEDDTYWVKPIDIETLHVPILQVPCSDLDDFIVCRN